MEFNFSVGFILAFWVFTTLIVNLSSAQDAGYVREAEMECMKNFPSITNELLEEKKRTKDLDPNAPTDMKCFVHCLAVKLKAIEGDEYVYDIAKQVIKDITGGQLSQAEIDDIVHKCGEIATHIDQCEKAWEFATCAVKDFREYRLHHTFCDTC